VWVLAAGLLTPIPAAGFVALMFVAAWTVHRANGFFIVKEGWEYNLILAVSAVAVATIGPGKFSLDYALLRTTGLYDYLCGWWGLLISAGLGLTGGVGQLAIFWRPPASAQGYGACAHKYRPAQSRLGSTFCTVGSECANVLL